VSLWHEIRTTVHRKEIPIVEAADPGIAAAAAANGTQAADSLEIFFQHSGIVIEVLAVSALALVRCFLSTGMHPSGQIHDEKSYETHRVTIKDSVLDVGRR
jgi:hypothetical protein